ncbi:hypothetical protein A2U01_0079301, partial [Trifolium medium]|nr:hypothetical protein [Trifolium medium]
MVKFKVKVKCGWKGKDKFYVKCIEFRMEGMNGEHLMEEDAAIVLL